MTRGGVRRSGARVVGGVLGVMLAGVAAAYAVALASVPPAAAQTAECRAVGSGTSWVLHEPGTPAVSIGIAVGVPGATVTGLTVEGTGGRTSTNNLPPGTSLELFASRTYPPGEPFTVEVTLDRPITQGAFTTNLINETGNGYLPRTFCLIGTGGSTTPSTTTGSTTSTTTTLPKIVPTPLRARLVSSSSDIDGLWWGLVALGVVLVVSFIMIHTTGKGSMGMSGCDKEGEGSDGCDPCWCCDDDDSGGEPRKRLGLFARSDKLPLVPLTYDELGRPRRRDVGRQSIPELAYGDKPPVDASEVPDHAPDEPGTGTTQREDATGTERAEDRGAGTTQREDAPGTERAEDSGGGTPGVAGGAGLTRTGDTPVDDCAALRAACERARADVAAKEARAREATAAAKSARDACRTAGAAVTAAQADLDRAVAEPHGPAGGSWVEDAATGERVTVDDTHAVNQAAQAAWNRYRSGEIDAHQLEDEWNRVASPHAIRRLREQADRVRTERIDAARRNLEDKKQEQARVCAAADKAEADAAALEQAAANARADATAICAAADDCERRASAAK